MAERSPKIGLAGTFLVVDAFPWPDAVGDAPAESILVPGSYVTIYRFEDMLYFVASETGDELGTDPSTVTLVATDRGIEIKVDRRPVAVVTPAYTRPYDFPGRRLRRLIGKPLPWDDPPYARPPDAPLSDLLDESGPGPDDIPAP
jgi:hypothetical protein